MFKRVFFLSCLLCSNVFASIVIPAGGVKPVSLVFHSDNKFAYGVNEATNNITEFKFDSQSGDLKEIGTIATGMSPTFGASFDNDGNYFLVTSYKQNKVYEYTMDRSSGALELIAILETGIGPIQAQFSADNKTLYVLSLDENAIYQYRFDPETGQLIGLSPLVFKTDVAPTGIGLSNDGKYMYEISSGGNRTTRYTMADDGQIQEHETYKLNGVFPVYSNFDATGKISLCTNLRSNNLDVFTTDVDTGVMKLVGSVNAGVGPNSLVVYDNSNKYAYVANDFSNDISVFELNSDAKDVRSIIKNIGHVASKGVSPDWLVTDQNKEYIYVVNANSNSITSFRMKDNGVIE